MTPPSLSFATFPIDWILLGVLAALIGFECFRAGPARASAIALALPIAAYLQSALGSAFLIGGPSASLSTPVLQAVLFLTLLTASYYLIHRMTYSYGDGAGSMAQAILVGVAAAAIIATIWVSSAALQNVWHFGTGVQATFGDAYRFWWLIAGFAALAYSRG